MARRQTTPIGSVDGHPAGSFSPPEPKISVVLADASLGRCRTARDALQRQAGIAVAATAGNEVEALELIRYYRPDVAIADIDLPGRGGPALATAVVEQGLQTRVLVASEELDIDRQMAVFRAGASGLLFRRSRAGGLADATRRLHAGGVVAPDSLLAGLIADLRAERVQELAVRPIRSTLTQREWEVLDLLSHEYDTERIAEELVLSKETVYTHVRNLLRKLGVHSRAEAVSLMRRWRDRREVPLPGGFQPPGSPE